MALYAIGDLHLSLNSDKSMDIFGDGWHDYIRRIREGFAPLCGDDVTVLCGDLSWGMSLEESLEDFRFLNALPGKKILLKGNHDYWWNTAAKMKRFFAENGLDTLEILHNNCLFYGDVALCVDNEHYDNTATLVFLAAVFRVFDVVDYKLPQGRRATRKFRHYLGRVVYLVMCCCQQRHEEQ